MRGAFFRFAKYAARIKEIESEADRITHERASQLNAPYADPINVIKWKAVYDRMGASPYFPRQTLH